MISYHSCAELETILNEAAVHAAFARKASIEMEDLVSTVLKQQYGAQEDISGIPAEGMEKVALHEAGHLVLCELLCPGSVGFTSLLPSEENHCGGFVHICKAIPGFVYCSHCIGRQSNSCGDAVCRVEIADGCASDIKRAVNSIREAAAAEGALGFSLLDVESRSSPPMSESLNARSEAAVQLELEQCYCKAKSILTQNDIFLKAVAEALVAKKTLLYSDIQAIRSTTVKSDQPMISNTVSQYRGAADAQSSCPRRSRPRRSGGGSYNGWKSAEKHNGPDLPHRPVPLFA